MADVMTVYSKLPAGLVLQLQEKVIDHEPVMGGGSRQVEIWRRTGGTVTLNGTAVVHGQMRLDVHGNPVAMVGGYAVTPVETKFWDEWVRQNATLPMLTCKPPLVFAHPSRASGDSMAKERASVRSGFEPLTPTLVDGGGKVIQSDPRVPASRNTVSLANAAQMAA